MFKFSTLSNENLLIRNKKYEKAKNPNTSKEELDSLAKKEVYDRYGNIDNFDEYYIKKSIAENPNTSIGTLEYLSEYEVKSVRGSVAANPNTPKDILYKLSFDLIPLVRGNVAQNTSTPTDVLYRLINDSNSKVKELATNHLNSLSSASSKLDSLMDEEFIPKSKKLSNSNKYR